MIFNVICKICIYLEISLLIFDECHNARKNHPYAQIMRHYARYIEDCQPLKVPKILGLTASPITTSLHNAPKEMTNQIKLLEFILCSKFVTLENDRSINDYIVIPEETIINIKSVFKTKLEQTKWEV
eukprot:Pgem_evm1s15137